MSRKAEIRSAAHQWPENSALADPAVFYANLVGNVLTFNSLLKAERSAMVAGDAWLPIIAKLLGISLAWPILGDAPLRELTGGSFDPTVQALWTLYWEHFAKPGHDPAGPSADALRTALDKVGFRHVAFDRSRIVLGRRGMGLTLNGIAQGYATDRVVALLRTEGIERSLVDMGESRAVGAREEGVPWRIGLADPDAPEQVGETLDLIDNAVATSGGYGFRFDRDGHFNHLLDPKSGGSARLYKSVTVIASTATAADGLSTAFSLLPLTEIELALRTVHCGQVRLTTTRDERIVLYAVPGLDRA